MRLLNYLYTDIGTAGGRPFAFSSIDNGGVTDEPVYSKTKAIQTPGGSGNYLSCGSSSLSIMGISRTTPTTVMVKIKSTDKTADRLWYGVFNESTGYGMGVFTSVTTGFPYILYKSGTTNLIKCVASTDVCNGNWHDVLAAYTGSGLNTGMTVFVNGLQPTQTRSGTYTIDPSFPAVQTVFGYTSTYCPIDGIVGECAVWNIAADLSMAQQIHFSYGDLRKIARSKNLRAWWWCGDGQPAEIDHIIQERGAYWASMYLNARLIGSTAIINDTYNL